MATLGEVAARGKTMLELRGGGCDRHGRLSVKRLIAQHGPDATVRQIMRAQIGDCPKKDSQQWYDRCDPYCPDLARLFSPYGPG